MVDMIYQSPMAHILPCGGQHGKRATWQLDRRAGIAVSCIGEQNRELTVDEFDSATVARPTVPRRISYALIGAGLAQGVAAGLLLGRLIRKRKYSLSSLTREIATNLGTYVYIASSTTAVFTLFGSLVGRSADQLAQLATTDVVTGLLNARAFRQRLHEEMVRATRYLQLRPSPRLRRSMSNAVTSQIITFAAIFAIFYFILIRPQQQQRKKHERALFALKKGDEVVTTGGIVGEVVHIRTLGSDGATTLEDRVTIKSGDARLVVERGKVTRIVGVETAKPAASSTS